MNHDTDCRIHIIVGHQHLLLTLLGVVQIGNQQVDFSGFSRRDQPVVSHGGDLQFGIQKECQALDELQVESGQLSVFPVKIHRFIQPLRSDSQFSGWILRSRDFRHRRRIGGKPTLVHILISAIGAILRNETVDFLHQLSVLGRQADDDVLFRDIDRQQCQSRVDFHHIFHAVAVEDKGINLFLLHRGITGCQ